MIRLSTSLVIVCLAAAAPARAEEDCAVPMARWVPRSAVTALAGQQGWNVLRIRLDDGCYEVTGLDARGRRFEAKLDPASLAIVEMEFEDHEDGGDSDDDEGDDD